jgi:hypothetical protein
MPEFELTAQQAQGINTDTLKNTWLKQHFHDHANDYENRLTAGYNEKTTNEKTIIEFRVEAKKKQSAKDSAKKAA